MTSKKTERKVFHLSKPEKKALDELADEKGLSTGAYIRNRLLYEDDHGSNVLQTYKEQYAKKQEKMTKGRIF